MMSDGLANEIVDLINLTVSNEYKGQRLDSALSSLFPHYSRSRLTRWIHNNQILVDGKCVKPNTKLAGGEFVSLKLSETEEELAFCPEPISLDVVDEDAALIIINKPPGMVVYPAVGNWSGTLLNGLLYRYPELACVPRAGIVHRLDKDTSGIMVVARTLEAQINLVRQLQARSAKRIYRAVANGHIMNRQVVDAPIGRDPHNRLRMAVSNRNGKTAVTHIRLLARYTNHSYIECSLETGRTHQIRVHLRSIGHALAGDPVYGTQCKAGEAVLVAIKALQRQALHAYQLSLQHPIKGGITTWQAPLPQDIEFLLSALRLDATAATE